MSQHQNRDVSNWLATLALATLATWQVFSVYNVKGGDNDYKFNFGAVPFFAELIKLLVTVALIYTDDEKLTLFTAKTWRQWHIYAVLAAIYMIINNIMFLALQTLDPLSYIALGNFKVVATGVLFFLCLGRNLTHLQWYALGILSVGLVLTQLGGCGELLSASWHGIAWSMMQACLSASAGVFTEMYLKTDDDSLHLQNFRLYACGTLINLARLSLSDLLGARDGVAAFDWLRGFDVSVWLVVLNVTITGLMVSFVMRSCPIYMKIISNSSTLILAYIIYEQQFSALEHRSTFHIFLGLLLICVSYVLYYTSPNFLIDAEFDKIDYTQWIGLVGPSITRASTHPSFIASDNVPAQKSAMDISA